MTVGSICHGSLAVLAVRQADFVYSTSYSCHVALDQQVNAAFRSGKVGALSDSDDRLAGLLEEAAETHHHVHRITDGTDDDCRPMYYARPLREQFASA